MSKPNGWDERDYQLSSQLQCLPSYGLLENGDRMISLKEVLTTIENLAKLRGNKVRYGLPTEAGVKDGRVTTRKNAAE